jgi:predicted CopG family antitoxin
MHQHAEFKHIVVSVSNYEKLRQIGPDESFNHVISRLIQKEQQEPGKQQC